MRAYLPCLPHEASGVDGARGTTAAEVAANPCGVSRPGGAAGRQGPGAPAQLPVSHLKPPSPCPTPPPPLGHPSRPQMRAHTCAHILMRLTLLRLEYH